VSATVAMCGKEVVEGDGRGGGGSLFQADCSGDRSQCGAEGGVPVEATDCSPTGPLAVRDPELEFEI